MQNSRQFYLFYGCLSKCLITNGERLTFGLFGGLLCFQLKRRLFPRLKFAKSSKHGIAHCSAAKWTSFCWPPLGSAPLDTVLPSNRYSVWNLIHTRPRFWNNQLKSSVTAWTSENQHRYSWGCFQLAELFLAAIKPLFLAIKFLVGTVVSCPLHLRQTFALTIFRITFAMVQQCYSLLFLYIRMFSYPALYLTVCLCYRAMLLQTNVHCALKTRSTKVRHRRCF